MFDNNFRMASAPADTHRLARIWGCLVALGVSLVVIGIAAIAYPAVATMTTVTAFGIIMLIGGMIELLSMFWVRNWSAFFGHLLSGLLYLFLGLVLVDRPALGAAGYTLLLSVFFVASGVARIVFALSNRFAGGGWTILSGAISVLLGVMIWRDMPEASLWVIGTFLGIDLIFNGLTWVMIGLALRKIAKPHPVEERAAGHPVHA